MACQFLATITKSSTVLMMTSSLLIVSLFTQKKQVKLFTSNIRQYKKLALGSHKVWIRLLDEVELVLQNNPKRGNVNVKVIKLTSEQILGIFSLYNEGAYFIELGFLI